MRGERDNLPELKLGEVMRAKRCLLSEPGLSHACRLRGCSRRRACSPESRKCLANSSTVILQQREWVLDGEGGSERKVYSASFCADCEVQDDDGERNAERLSSL